MKIVICGAGEIGTYACEVLDRRGESVTVVDQRPERLRALEENLDIRTLEGNCGRADVLAEPGVYVVVVVEAPCELDDDPDTLCTDEHGCDCEPAGWAVLKLDGWTR